MCFKTIKTAGERNTPRLEHGVPLSRLFLGECGWLFCRQGCFQWLIAGETHLLMLEGFASLLAS